MRQNIPVYCVFRKRAFVFFQRALRVCAKDICTEALYIPQKSPVNSAKYPCKLYIPQKSPTISQKSPMYPIKKPCVCSPQTKGFRRIYGLFCEIHNLQGCFAELTGLFCGIYRAPPPPMYRLKEPCVCSLRILSLCDTVCCIVLQCVAVCSSVLQCDAVCFSVLQCDAVCCSVCTHTRR